MSCVGMYVGVVVGAALPLCWHLSYFSPLFAWFGPVHVRQSLQKPEVKKNVVTKYFKLLDCS